MTKRKKILVAAITAAMFCSNFTATQAAKAEDTNEAVMVAAVAAADSRASLLDNGEKSLEKAEVSKENKEENAVQSGEKDKKEKKDKKTKKQKKNKKNKTDEKKPKKRYKMPDEHVSGEVDLDTFVSAKPDLKAVATSDAVLFYNNPALAALPDKDAILVVTSGVASPSLRAATIEPTVNRIKRVHPNVKVITAFIDKKVINEIKTKEEVLFPTPLEALDQLKAAGYSRVAVANLGIVPAEEYMAATAAFESKKNDFKKIACGTPLMFRQGQQGVPDDIDEAVRAISGQFPRQAKKEAILLLTPGTKTIGNAYYTLITEKLKELSFSNIYLVNGQGWPNFGMVGNKLKQTKIKKVTLFPLTLAADKEEMNAIGKLFEDAGYDTNVITDALGTGAAVQNIFLRRADEAFDVVTSK